jgi:phage host-nuclease inhibitor protein Gam
MSDGNITPEDWTEIQKEIRKLTSDYNCNGYDCCPYAPELEKLKTEIARLREAAQDYLDSTREAGPEGWKSRATKRLEIALQESNPCAIS